MALEAPNLDNRRFQDLVDEAKRLIPRFCPEWTDHNVSDPGIALVELFAWMTETLLYRANQVPEKNYLKFLEMLGVKLDPPRSASAPVTFYLSAPQSGDITIPQGTEAATVRTETEPAIVFTTEADLTMRPPRVRGIFTQRAALGDNGWVTHDLTRLTLQQSIILFPNPPCVLYRAGTGSQPPRARNRRRIRAVGRCRHRSVEAADSVGGLAGRSHPLGGVRSGARHDRGIQRRRRVRPAAARDGRGRVRR
jgi:hypothetical protein